MQRDTAIEGLICGTWEVKLELQVAFPTSQPVQLPAQVTQLENIRYDKVMADVKFLLDNDRVSFAHTLALWSEVRFLYSLLQGAEETSGKKVLRLEGYDHRSFEMILDFVYLRKIPGLTDADKIQKMLVLADRLEIVGLKVAMEVELSNRVSTSNAVSMVSFAEAHSCALLLEESVIFSGKTSSSMHIVARFLRKADTVLISVSFCCWRIVSKCMV